MLSSLLITLREGLEAALIVGIILSLLVKLNQENNRKMVWLGVGAAVLISVAAGLVLNALGMAFEGRSEEIFEGVMMLTAAGVLTWMIFWMQRHGRQMQAKLENEVRDAAQVGSEWAFFTLAFVAVLREGIETALFMTATLMSTTPVLALTGGLLGLAIAILLGYLIFAAGKQLNLKVFFQVTSAFLLVVAAGMIAYGIHELQEAAVLPIVVEHVWDINHILNEKATVGLFMKALFGYNGNPSLIEVVVYSLYLLVGGTLVWQSNKPRLTASPAH